MRRIILDTHIFLWLIDEDFDRLIICQSLQYNLTIMTEDQAILNYPQLNLYPTNVS
jgi:PIN domain nuclease of toxin-antitoxin system